MYGLKHPSFRLPVEDVKAAVTEAGDVPPEKSSETIAPRIGTCQSFHSNGVLTSGGAVFKAFIPACVHQTKIELETSVEKPALTRTRGPK